MTEVFTEAAKESDVASTHHEDAQEQKIQEITDANPGNVVINDEPESE